MNFINYMISDKVSYKNTVEVGYLTANVNAAAQAEKEEFKDIDTIEDYMYILNNKNNTV